MQIAKNGFVLVLLVALVEIVMCDGEVLGKCHITRHTNDKVLEYYADCSHLNLTDIPNNLPPSTTCLNMIGNKLSEINGKALQRYKSLKCLSLSRNRIDSISSRDFAGLSKLKMLDLSLNKIRYTNISEDAFTPLKALTLLDIKQSLSNTWINEKYPVALNQLRHLHTLVIDGLGTQTLPYMPNLIELYMSGEYGRCNIPNINEIFFENILGVQNVFMSKCSIKKIEYNTFKPLRNITSLDLSWNINLGIESMPNITSGLNGSKTLKRLNLNTLYDHSQFDFCSSVSIDDIKYLSNTSIELLTVENNNIVRMDIASVIQWPKSIKYLSVQHNMFLYGNYTPFLILSGTVNNIVYLDVSRMAASNRPISTARYDVSMEKKLEQRLQPNTYETFQPEITVSSFHSLCMSMFTRNQVLDYFQVIENKLKRHDIETENKLIESVQAHSPSKLEYLDISDNLPVLIERIFEIFPKIPNLKVLNVSRNYLGYPLYDGTAIVGHLNNIRTLDLSDNKIIQLMPNIFNNLSKLENLHLSRNKINNITFELSHLKNLSYLDLEENNLESINLAARDALDQLLNIRINIAQNNLKCSCDNIDFLFWVKRNTNKIVKLEETNCTLGNATLVSLATLNYEELDLECSSNLTTILLAVISIFIFIMIITCPLLYTFRWNLSFVYHLTMMKLFTDYVPIEDEEDREGVFVAYADEDRDFALQQVKLELEEKGEIPLKFHERDFDPGEKVVRNIIKAIQSTHKTLIILTRAFVKSDWCKFELSLARNMEGDKNRRNILCVIMKEKIPRKDMPLELIDILLTRTYLNYPNTDAEDKMQIFWDRLRAALKHDM